jgi:cysteine desulfurase
VVSSFVRRALAEGKRPQWICSAVEHDSLIAFVPVARELGAVVTVLPVDPEGRPDLERLGSLWDPACDARLLSVVWVNNETGVKIDPNLLATACESNHALLHLDAAQAWGKIPVSAAATPAQFLTFSAHKIGGLPGTGILWQRPGFPILPLHPGKQEKGRRGGTENIAGILAAGEAARHLDPVATDSITRPLRDRLEREILATIPGARINGAGAERVGNTLNLSVEGLEGEGLVMALDLEGWSVSAGSACSSGAMEPSHVLMAMGRSRAEAMAAIRVSIGGATRWDDLAEFAEVLKKVNERIRRK